jgi:transcriptional regulator with XRE-family HTH domain
MIDAPKVRSLMAAQGLSHYTLASTIQASPSSLSRVLSLAVPASQELLGRIAEALGVDVADITTADTPSFLRSRSPRRRRELAVVIDPTTGERIAGVLVDDLDGMVDDIAAERLAGLGDDGDDADEDSSSNDEDETDDSPKSPRER